MTSLPSILLISRDEELAYSLQESLVQTHQVVLVENLKDAETAREEFRPEAVAVDIGAPFEGLRWTEQNGFPPRRVVVILENAGQVHSVPKSSAVVVKPVDALVLVSMFGRKRTAA